MLKQLPVDPTHPRERYLRTLRHLAVCYQAFERCSAAQIRQLGLTPPQFDIIVSLGNTSGMTFKDLGEHALVTKGTLTGIVDRLVDRGLVERREVVSDKRSMLVCLTPAGHACFTRVYATHIAYLKTPFTALSETQLDALDHLLGPLTDQLDAQRERYLATIAQPD